MPLSSMNLLCLGGKMNDTSYPFRGEYKVEDAINHGHSGVAKHAPTSLTIKISGSNMVIEELHAPKGVEMSCNLDMDGKNPRPINLSQHGRKMGLGVPSDGHNYQLTTTVQGNKTRHYCRLILKGNEEQGIMWLRTPEDSRSAMVNVIVDGKVLRPEGGFFRIPLSATDLRLVVDSPGSFAREGGEMPQQNSFFIREHEVNIPEEAPHSTANPKRVSIPCGLPCLADSIHTYDHPLFDSSSPTFMASVAPPFTISTKPSAPPPPPTGPLPKSGEVASSVFPNVMPAYSPPLVITPVELETHVHSVDKSFVFTAIAPNHIVQLVDENSATVSTPNTAAITLPHRRAQCVQVSVSNFDGQVVLRQRCHVPACEPAPITLQLQEDPSNAALVIRGSDHSKVSLNGSPGESNAFQILPSGAPQLVRVEQTNADGSMSSAHLSIGPKPPLPPPPPPPVAEPTWLMTLAEAIQAPTLSEAQRLLQQPQPTTPAGLRVLQFVRERLLQATPELHLTPLPAGGIAGVRCPGSYSITAAVDGAPAAIIPPDGSISAARGSCVALTLTQSGMPPAVATCCVHLPHSAPPPPAASPATDPLLARLIDCFERHRRQPSRVAAELAGIPAETLSAAGQRLVPLLLDCLSLLSTMEAGEAAPRSEPIRFTAHSGYLSDIHTQDPRGGVFCAVDGGVAEPVGPHGRVPRSGAFPAGPTPHAVRLFTKDPTTGSPAGGEVCFSMMGAEPAAGGAGVGAANALPPEGTASAPPKVVSRPALEANPTTAAPAKVPYLDLSMRQEGPDVYLRVVARHDHRIACEVDGVGGDTARSDFTARLTGSYDHRVNLSLIAPDGNILFQQKLAVPAMGSSVWGVALSDRGLAIDVDACKDMTMTLDQEPERGVQGNYISLNTNEPHYLTLRRYHASTGIRGGSYAELSLRLPSFISSSIVKELARLYRLYVEGGLNTIALRQHLLELKNRASSPETTDLIQSLMDALEKGDVSASPRRSASPSKTGHIYFRLKGTS